jgi:hypothetical protein
LKRVATLENKQQKANLRFYSIVSAENIYSLIQVSGSGHYRRLPRIEPLSM